MSKQSLSEQYLHMDDLLRETRRVSRGKDGVRRKIMTKEEFLTLKDWLNYKPTDSKSDFFTRAEKEGIEFGIYDDIFIMSGIAGPYYKSEDGKDHVFILIRS